VEIGTETAHSPEKEYIKGIFVAVYSTVGSNGGYLLGGYIEPSVSARCEMYCPVARRWSSLPEMRLERSALNTVVLTWDTIPDLPAILAP
jgi:hypothetical protein